MEREACVCDHGFERSDLCAEIIIIINGMEKSRIYISKSRNCVEVIPKVQTLLLLTQPEIRVD